MKSLFFALVGPSGAGKTRVQDSLKGIFTGPEYLFLTDSCGLDGASHAPFTTGVSELALGGTHAYATPMGQLLFFWGRLVTIIEHDVAPALKAGRTVIMNGFGGTVLAHALAATDDEAERGKLIELHKTLILHCVVGHGVPPPQYIWLKPSPEIAQARLMGDGRGDLSLTTISRLNEYFEFYGNLPGQRVESVNANHRPEVVLGTVLRIMGAHTGMPDLVAA